MNRASPLALALALALASCSADNATPEGTVKAFRTAVASLDSDKVHALLAPKTQRQLKALAEQATLQTGGRHQLKPTEMLLLGLLQPESDVDRVEVISSSDGRARVRLVSSGKKKVTEELQLVQVEGGWRVLLEFKQPD